MQCQREFTTLHDNFATLAKDLLPNRHLDCKYQETGRDCTHPFCEKPAANEENWSSYCKEKWGKEFPQSSLLKPQRLATSRGSKEYLTRQGLEFNFLETLSDFLASLADLFRLADQEDDNPDGNSKVVLGDNNCYERQNLNDQFDEAADVRFNYPSVTIDFKEKDRLSTGSNYDVWTIRMKRWFLLEANLWEFVDGTIPWPPRERNMITRELEPKGEIHKE